MSPRKQQTGFRRRIVTAALAFLAVFGLVSTLLVPNADARGWDWWNTSSSGSSTSAWDYWGDWGDWGDWSDNDSGSDWGWNSWDDDDDEGDDDEGDDVNVADDENADDGNNIADEAANDGAVVVDDVAVDVIDESPAVDPGPWLPADYDHFRTGSMWRVIRRVGGDDLWNAGYSGAGVDVAVIDTGVAPVAPLVDPDKVVAVVDLSFDGPYEDARYLDFYGHGTHMAGIIAGRSPGAEFDNPEQGDFMGLAPNAGLVSVKVGDNGGAVDVSQVIAGIDWVIQHRNADGLNIRVLHLAYGTDSTQDYRESPLAYAVERAWDAGIVVVVAAGNESYTTGFLANPATDPYVISVGREGRKYEYGLAELAGATAVPDVLAPGESIESLMWEGSRAATMNPGSTINGQLIKGTGSSQAAAVVSGGVAAMLEARPELTPDQVKALLTSTTTWSGLVQFDRAVSAGVPANHVQTWEKSTASGTLDADRGSHRLIVNGIEVSGEVTANGAPFVAEDWKMLQAQGASWAGASWAGSSWAGASWAGSSWAGASWAGSSWAGASWAGSSWAGSSWAGSSWAGASWAGASWAGSSWAGASWAGSSWAGASWQGTVWG